MQARRHVQPQLEGRLQWAAAAEGVPDERGPAGDNLPLAVDQVASLLVSKAKNAGLHNKSLSDADRQEKSRGVLASAIEEFRMAAPAADASFLPPNVKHLRGLMGTVRLWIDWIRSLPRTRS